ncbi:uncharacterized protein [Leptinotarsa decemlineata]|uniref:uncharacterized protein n=1 Tax=Leptinotarsa decemlineata TaxID=7539 RepID=UPI003D307D42
MKAALLLICITSLLSMIFSHPVGVEDQVQNPGFVRAQRQAGGGGHHHDVVDFGAHTGDHGAFGWYADFPVHGGY